MFIKKWYLKIKELIHIFLKKQYLIIRVLINKLDDNPTLKDSFILIFILTFNIFILFIYNPYNFFFLIFRKCRHKFKKFYSLHYSAKIAMFKIFCLYSLIFYIFKLKALGITILINFYYIIKNIITHKLNFIEIIGYFERNIIYTCFNLIIVLLPFYSILYKQI